MTTVSLDHSPPIESPEELLTFFRASEKPREKWRIGVEHEKLGLSRKERRPLHYGGENGIRNHLQAFVEKFGWSPVMEGENLIALKRSGANITLEPGGQLELSGVPLHNVHEVCAELLQYEQELKEISGELDTFWLALGHHPELLPEEMPWMPKNRYSIMKSYMGRQGARALEMMLSTATVQTNLDYSSEADMARKVRVTSLISPFLTALFANSPFSGGSPSGFLSTRARAWRDTDPDRCGIPPAVFKRDFGYGDYVEFALAAPMFFLHREGRYLDYTGSSFRDFMERGLDGHVATQEDWILHLTTLFPEVRLKNVIELRMADVGSQPIILSLTALTRGLLYDDQALRETEGLVGDLRPSIYPELMVEVSRIGLRAVAGGRPVLEWVREILDIAAAGLERLDALDEKGENEVKYLLPLRRIVETGKSQAELLLDSWNGRWDGSMEPLYQAVLNP